MRLEGWIVLSWPILRDAASQLLRMRDPNTFAPEGASRCRALTSGLKDRAAGRKERLSEIRVTYATTGVSQY
jgi:hypothetical protein